MSLDAARSGVYVGDLDTRRSVRLLDTESPAVFAPPRHLLHVQHDMLIAEELDASTWQLTGRATLLARDVSPPSLADDDIFSAAGDLIAYRHGIRQQQLAWVDRAGEVLATLPMPAVMFNPRVSPDGSRLLATGSVTTNPGLWLASLSRQEFERIETDAIAPLWSPDGARIAFTARGGFDLLIRPSSGTESTRLNSDGVVKILNDWSPAGDHIIYSQRGEGTKLDLWGIRVEDGATFPILRPRTTSCKRECRRTAAGSRTWRTTAARSRSTCSATPSSASGTRCRSAAAGNRNGAEISASSTTSRPIERWWPWRWRRIRHPFGPPRRLFARPWPAVPTALATTTRPPPTAADSCSTARSAMAATARSRWS